MYVCVYMLLFTYSFKTQRVPILHFSPYIPPTAGTGLGQSLELGAKSVSPTMVAKVQLLELPPIASHSVPQQETRIESRAGTVSQPGQPNLPGQMPAPYADLPSRISLPGLNC